MIARIEALRSLLFVALMFSAAVTGAMADGRVALVVGNSDYRRDELDLRNPVNDARALETTLSGMGFDVTVLVDADAPRMRTALAGFAARARDAETALFFYAGHGVQIAGENLLVGTAFDASDAAGLRDASLAMSEVKSALEAAAPRAGLILLDACRDAPVGDDGMAQGLVRTGGGAGLLIAYATDPGNVAYDGEGENSVFTRALLEHLATPGLDVRLMLGRVRQQVVLDTFGQQVPWVEEALIGDQVLVPGVSTSAEDPFSEEIALWRAADAGTEETELRNYLKLYPDGLFASVARTRLQRHADGQRVDETPVPSVWASADRNRVAPALAALGYLPRTASGHADLDAALQSYLADTPGQTDPDRLYGAAAQSLTALAGATAQRLRTDLVALKSVDRLLKISRGTLAEIEDIARMNADADAVLSQARQDFDGIERSRRVILMRLDQSRGYYADLLALASRVLPEASAIPVLAEGDTTSGIDDRLRADASLFLRHVAAADRTTEGSYSWLADFLRQS